MKYLFVFLIAFTSLNIGQAQDDAISKYFNQYVDDQDFTVVYVSAKMFELLGKLDLTNIDDQEAQVALEMVDKLKGIRVLTTEKEPGKYYQEAVKKINTKEFELLVKVRDEDQNVQLLTKSSGDIISELLVLVGGDDEFVLVSIIGNIDLKHISKLANKLNMKGVEHLDKIDEEEKRAKAGN